jgi:ATP-dependent DNA helicase RecG
LFVGANDNGEAIGLRVTDQMLLTISCMRDDGNILPLPSMTVQKRTLKNRELIVVEVQPSDAPPVRFKGVVRIRVGPRRASATPDEECRLSEKRRHRDLPSDIQPLPSVPMSELDQLVFKRDYLPAAISSDVLEQNDRSLNDQLLATRFAYPGPPVCPTILGVLVIGKNPTAWVPGGYIQFVRFDGAALEDPVQASHELRSSLPELLRDLDELLKINIHSALDFSSGDLEIRKPDYPLVALQQITRNAVLHRSYEHTNAPTRVYWFADRVEVQNPGGPFGQVTRENFGCPGVSDYRNPNLAAVMKELGYVQRFGVGIVLARQEMDRNGNPPLEFQVQDSYVAAILRRRT